MVSSTLTLRSVAVEKRRSRSIPGAVGRRHFGGSRCFGEALVVSRDKSLKKAVGLAYRINAGKPHLFAQSILKGLAERLDATFGLRGERWNGANTKLFDVPLDLVLRFASGEFIFNGGLLGERRMVCRS